MDGPTPLTPRRLFPWLGLTAFASGVPYALVTKTAPALYTAHGVDVTHIGLFSGLVLGWPLKFFIAPLVDRFGARRVWIPLAQLAIAGVLLALSRLPDNEVVAEAWIGFGLVALLGGLADVATDGYALDATPPALAGPAGGIRTGLYRVAMAVAGGTLLARAPSLGWSGTWQVAAVMVAVLACAAAFLPSAPRTRAQTMQLVAPIRELLSRSSSLGLVVFVLLYKIGDRAMAPMADRFLQERIALPVFGDIVTPLVILASLAGALVGGWLTRRWGVVRALVLLGLAQALSNMGYAAAAASDDAVLVWSAALVEPFCGGLGTAPFVALFMLACARANAATQYAFLTALMGLVGGAIGIPGGWFKEALGFPIYFLATGLLALPPLLLVPAVARWLGAAPRPQADSGATA